MKTTHHPTDAEGLLERIAESALDDDYYAVAPATNRSFHARSLLTIGSLAVFSLLITITAVQTRNDRPATNLERQTLIGDVEARKQVLTIRENQAAQLRDDVTKLRASTGRTDATITSTQVLTGDRAATGNGVMITVGPGPEGAAGRRITDTDLQLLVNGLWYAGAEAISINGQRIGTLTAIRSAGSQMTINYRSVGSPYVVIALGDGDAIEQRFSDNPGGQYWGARRRTSGLGFSMRSSSGLKVEAVPHDRLTLRHAEPIEEESP